MPEFGDIKRAEELGFKGHGHKLIWTRCEHCGKGRWVRLRLGKPIYNICKSCSRKVHTLSKGHSITTHQGYLKVKIYPDNPCFPMADCSKYIMVHRLVMARHLGRCLQPWEKVHHKNGDKTDNRIENLELTMLGAHSISHHKGYKDGYLKGFNDGKEARKKQLLAEIEKLKAIHASS